MEAESIGIISQKRLTRGTVTRAVRRAARPSGRARCGAGAGGSAICGAGASCSAIPISSLQIMRAGLGVRWCCAQYPPNFGPLLTIPSKFCNNLPYEQHPPNYAVSISVNELIDIQFTSSSQPKTNPDAIPCKFRLTGALALLGRSALDARQMLEEVFLLLFFFTTLQLLYDSPNHL